MLENPIQSVPAAEVAGKTLVEEFMAMSYEFRRNVLSDKYEMREVCNDSEALSYLLDKEYVYRSDNGYIVYDRFMGLWLLSQA